MSEQVSEASTTTGVASLGARAATGAFWITIEMVTVQALSLLVFAVLAHLLKPRDFGLAAICFAFIYSLKQLTFDQMVTPLLRKVSASNLEYTTAFWMSAIFGVTTVLVLCGFSFVADRIFHTSGLGAVMRPMSLMLIALSLSRTQEAWLMRHFRFRILAIRSIIGMFLGAAAGIAAAFYGLGVWSLVIQQSVGSFSSLGMLWMSTPWRPGFEFSGKSAAELMMFLRGISGNAFLGILNQNADTAIIAAFFGPGSAGVYTVGKRLRLALQLVASNPVNLLALPSLSEAQEDPVRQRHVFLMASRLVFTCCAPVFLGAAAVATPAIVLLFGSRWAGAGNVFAWLSVGGLCALAFDYFGTILLMRNRPTWLTGLAAVQTTLSIALFVLLHASGMRMIAAPFVLPYIVTVPACAVLALRLLDLKILQWLKAVSPPLFAALLMSLITRALSPILGAMPESARLAILCTTGAVVYGILMTILARDTVMIGVRFVRDRLARA